MAILMNSTSTSLLVRLRQSGQEDAWSRFVELYSPLLHFWTQHLGVQNQDAADLVQEVFVVLVRKLPEFEYNPKLGFRRWLRTVLLNKWRNFCRQRGLTMVLQTADEMVAPEDSAFGEMEYRQHLVKRALELMQAEFSANMWKACWEHVVVGRSAAAVAAELGIAEGTVYVAKARVLFRLRQELGGLLE
jgi:RNA polymerase sigma-70 factor (ECF subfamily)